MAGNFQGGVTWKWKNCERMELGWILQVRFHDLVFAGQLGIEEKQRFGLLKAGREGRTRLGIGGCVRRNRRMWIGKQTWMFFVHGITRWRCLAACSAIRGPIVYPPSAKRL
jgi:hypothetical protein